MKWNEKINIKTSKVWTEYTIQVLNSIYNIKQKFDDLKLVENNSLVDRWKIIANYIKNYPNIFKDFLEQNQKTVNINNSQSIIQYINNFFEYIEKYLNFEEEIIIWIKWDILYNESLLRLNIESKYYSEKQANHINFLELCNDTKLTFKLFKIVLKKLFKWIKNWEITWNAWINIEVSDIMNNDFIWVIKELSKKYSINLKKEWIVLEILENENKPKNKEFSDKIIELKKIWFKIWYDDELVRDKNSTNNKTTTELVTELIELSKKESPHIIKLDKSFIWELSKANKSTGWWIELPFLKRIIQNCNSHWTKVVAEWIEEEYMLDFCINVLWIEYYQWYMFRNQNNIDNFLNITNSIIQIQKVREEEKKKILKKLAINS